MIDVEGGFKDPEGLLTAFIHTGNTTPSDIYIHGHIDDKGNDTKQFN